MYNVTYSKEIFIETPNEKGEAAKLSQYVSSQAKVNMWSIWGYGFDGQGRFAIMTDDNQKAMEALKGDYPSVKEYEVLVLEAKDTVGEVAEVTEMVSKAGININYIYTTYINGRPSIVMSTEDNKKAYSLFGG